LDTVERDMESVQAVLGQMLVERGGAPWKRAGARLQEKRGGLTPNQAHVFNLRTNNRLGEGERKRVSVRECIDSVVTIMRHRLGTRIAVATELRGPDAIECFAGLFNQAIMNLVANAIDAIDGDGSITITSEFRNDQFELCVTDTGHGIPEQIQERVFDPFFTTKPVGQGTGLGLSITDSIAKRHGGRIELCSSESGGTRATLRFPLTTTGEGIGEPGPYSVG
jgi:two-component system, NtrC family, sensor kinase